ncbi:MAG: hypothetical protein AB7H88_09745 [Vicinamibacterales bacterium]
MPVLEPDPWRQPFFASLRCPRGVVIPTKDPDAYELNPEYRWVYNKLAVAESQGLACAPHGVRPTTYPVFKKPAFNLRSMGHGSRALRDARDYDRHMSPGDMWMPLLTGAHVSTDLAVVDGRVAWLAHARGAPAGGGTFDYWAILDGDADGLDGVLRAWVRRHLRRYTGMVNVETIGGRIIEVHLRFADQWADLYGPAWGRNLVALYAGHGWPRATPPRAAWSVVLFLPHGGPFQKPPAALTAGLLRDDRVSSVQYPFHLDRSPSSHAMPPGGFRVAIVNGWDLDACVAARRRIAAWYGKRSRRTRAA